MLDLGLDPLFPSPEQGQGGGVWREGEDCSWLPACLGRPGSSTENSGVTPTALSHRGRSAPSPAGCRVCPSPCVDNMGHLPLPLPQNFTEPLLGGCYFGVRVTGEETEAQSGEAACPRPHSQEAVGRRFKARSLLSKAGVIAHHPTRPPIPDYWGGADVGAPGQVLRGA